MKEYEDAFVVNHDLEIHPCALIMPPMDEETYDKFKVDISGHGLIHPIVLYQGKILDGRNRYNACKELDVEIWAREWEGGSDPVTYVVSNNIHRRHLSPGQRAIAAAKAINFWADEAKERQVNAGKEYGRGIEKVVEPLPQAIEKEDDNEEAKDVGDDNDCGKARDLAGQQFGVSGRSVSSAKFILEHGTDEEIKSIESGKSPLKPVEEKVRERIKIDPVQTKAPSKFNETNDSIEWARWSWNPVTGCEHGCPYCYARDIAFRFTGNFDPTFHEERLSAPQNTKLPDNPDGGNRKVFVCSMADLFGDWVPQEWIDKVIDACRNAPEWTFIFLTKNPKRLVDIDWPENAWVGTTVDCQDRVNAAIESFEEVKATIKLLSCEPLLENIEFPTSALNLFDWVIIGGQSVSSGAPAFQPEWEWVESLHNKARECGCAVYWKPNLTVRPKEYPSK